MLKTVIPLAKLAAIIKFSVAPTDIFENLILFPINPLGAVAWTYPWTILYLTPKLDKAFKWISTGLVPIAQPPGSDTLALPNLASKGPRTKIPALIVLTKLYEAKLLVCLILSITKLFWLNLILDPNDCNKLTIVSISFTLGKFFNKSFFFDNKVAAKIGRDAFFEPDIFICPLSLFAPKTSSFCMTKL